VILEKDRIAWLYRETLRRVEAFEGRVREGRDLDAALSFAGFVINSGIAHLCKPYSQDGPFRIDGAHLQWRCEELQRSARDGLIRQGRSVALPETYNEVINRKLDVIAGYMSRLLDASAQVSGAAGETGRAAAGVAPDDPRSRDGRRAAGNRNGNGHD